MLKFFLENCSELLISESFQHYYVSTMKSSCFAWVQQKLGASVSTFSLEYCNLLSVFSLSFLPFWLFDAF